MSGRARRITAAGVAVLLLLGGCAGSSVPDAAEPAQAATVPATVVPEPTEVTVPVLAMNHVQVMGSHNSYHLLPPQEIFDALQTLSPELASSRAYEHRSLTEQLETFGIRQLEIDVYADPDGGLFINPAVNFLVGLPGLDDAELAEPGFKTLHIPDYDYATSCLTFVSCLEEISAWSTANPSHIPVVVLVEYKSESVAEAAAADEIELPALPWAIPLAATTPLLEDLDAELRSVFSPSQLITPDDVRGDAETLNAAVTTSGWPSLDDSRGKVLFALLDEDVSAVYAADNLNLEGRPMFTSGVAGEPDAAFLLLDDAFDPAIDSLAQEGYLVRTRTDLPTTTARDNDRERLDAAAASGAHLLSTDYYTPSEVFESPYVAALPGDVHARCNPVTAPPTCTDDQLTD